MKLIEKDRIANLKTPHIEINYVCHPYRSDPVLNVDRVRDICKKVSTQGAMPLAPQIYLPQFVNEMTERDLALRCCLRLVSLAEEVWVYGEPTEGMRLEIAEARRLGIPVVYRTKEEIRK